MSQGREPGRGREEISLRKRSSIGSVQCTKTEKMKERDRDKEKGEGDGGKERGIRTRLSTGSIHMNGTTTIAVAREIENNQRLLGKTVSKETNAEPATPSSVKKRSISKETSPAESVSTSAPPPPKKRKIGRNDGTGEDNRNDYFCWLCHKEGTVVCCELCPRVYHLKCLEVSGDLPKDWVCPECERIMRAECVETRSKAMSMISIETLCTLLKYAIERMKHQGSDPFTKPVDLGAVPYYTDYIYNPMDLTQLEKNIKKKMYGCTEAFLADAKWILHNCIIFNGTHHKLTSSAKMIIKICKHEMSEIELCPDCYLNSCIRKNDEWFSETCRTPHTLVWAKLKGYPFWPAKALREVDGQVDVRFFGAHDRSWVSTSQVFLLSKDIPTPAKNKKGGFDNAMEELEIHIEKIKDKFGKFEYLPYRTPYDKNHVYCHNKMKIPVKKGFKKQKFYSVERISVNRVSSPIKKAPKSGTILRQNSDMKMADKQSAMMKKASAVRQKYNSIITTRHSSSESPHSSPVKSNTSSPFRAPPGVFSASDSEETKAPKISGPAMDEKGEKLRALGLTQTPKKSTHIKLDIVEKIKSKIDEMNRCTEQESYLESEDVKPGNLPVVTESSTRIKSEANLTPERKPSLVGSPALVISSVESQTNTTILKAPSGQSDKEEGSEANICKGKDLADSDASDNESLDSPEQGTPSKTEYLANLRRTILSCKEKLGITDDKLEKVGESLSGNDTEDESLVDETDEKLANSCEESDVELQGRNSNESALQSTGIGPSDKEVGFQSGTSEHDKVVNESCCEMESKDAQSVDSCAESSSDKLSSVNNKASEEIMSTDSVNKNSGAMEVCEGEKKLQTGNPGVEVCKEGLSANSMINNTSCENTGTEKSSNASVTTTDMDTSQAKDVVPASDDKPESSDKTESSDITKSSDKTASSDITESSDKTASSDKPASPDKSVSSDKTASSCQSDKEVAGKSDDLSLMMEVDCESEEERDEGEEVDGKEREEVSGKEENVPSEPTLPTVVKEVGDDIRSEFEKTESRMSNKQLVTTPPPVKVKMISKARQQQSQQAKKVKQLTNIRTLLKISPQDKKQLSSSSNTQLSSEFFQSAVEKTLKPKSDLTGVSRVSVTSTAPSKTLTTDIVKKTGMYTIKSMTAKIPTSVETIGTPAITEPLPAPGSSSDNKPELPTSAKELIARLSNNLASKIKDSLEELCTELLSSADFNTKQGPDKDMEAEIARLEWEQKQQLVELKHNFQLTVSEMKSCWDAEKHRIVSEIKTAHGKEKEQAITETKKKQWCANCGKEAIFYCCWNTSYCDYPCQQSHWPTHMPNCMQTQNTTNENEASDKTSQSSSASVTPQDQGSQDDRQSQQRGSSGSSVVDPIEIESEESRRGSRDNLINNMLQQQQQHFQRIHHQQQQQPHHHQQPQSMQYLPPNGMPPHTMQHYMPIQPRGGVPVQSRSLCEDPQGSRKKANYYWSEQAMEQALNSVLKEGMSVNKASKVYNVPRNKLTERLGNRVPQVPQNSQAMNNTQIAGGPVQFQYIGQQQAVVPPSVQHLNSPPQVRMQAVQVQNQSVSTNLMGARPLIAQGNQVMYQPIQVCSQPQPSTILQTGQMIISQAGHNPQSNIMPSSMGFHPRF